MSKVLKIIIFLLFLIFTLEYFIPSISLADYNESLSKYNTGYDKYRTSYQQYIKNKNSYLTYQTLSSQTDALNSTKILLEDRAQVLIDYFSLLKEKTLLTPGFVPLEQNISIGLIEDRISFLSSHQSNISAITSLNDLVQKSGEVDKIKEKINIEAENIIGSILISKVAYEKEKLNSFISQISELIIEIKSQGNDVTKLERWLLETRNKYQLCSDKLSNAKEIINGLTPDKYNDSKVNFNKAKQEILEGHQYLKEATYNAKEALQEIKYGNYQ